MKQLGMNELLQNKATGEVVSVVERNAEGGVFVTFQTGRLEGRSTWFRETDLEPRCTCARCEGAAECTIPFTKGAPVSYGKRLTVE